MKAILRTMLHSNIMQRHRMTSDTDICAIFGEILWYLCSWSDCVNAFHPSASALEHIYPSYSWFVSYRSVETLRRRSHIMPRAELFTYTPSHFLLFLSQNLLAKIRVQWESLAAIAYTPFPRWSKHFHWVLLDHPWGKAHLWHRGQA